MTNEPFGVQSGTRVDASRPRRGRLRASMSATAAVLTMIAMLTACTQTRSVDSYCAVIAEHKERYLNAMDQVNASADPVAGIAGVIAALGDLQRMWDEAAQVAPDEIRADVEAVATHWASQFETAEKMATDPLGALASGLVGGLANAGAMQRVDEFTAQNCPGSGTMLGGTIDTDATPDSTATTAADSETIALPDGNWNPFGPFLAKPQMRTGRAFALEGPITLFVPGNGVITVDAATLLPDEEVVEQSHIYVFDDERPFLASAVVIRVPAAGLEPEHFVEAVLGVDVEGSPRVTSRVDVGEGDQQSLDVRGSSRDGVVAIQRGLAQENGDWVFSSTGVDLLDERVVWHHENTSIIHPGAFEHVALVTHSQRGGPCGTVATVVGTEVATGDSTWTQPDVGISQSQVGCPAVLDEPYGRFVGMKKSGDPPFVFDAETGTSVEIARPVFEFDPLGTVGALEFHTGGAHYVMDFVLVDLSTGEEVFSIDLEQAKSLGLEVSSIFDDILYVTTTDEQLAIAPRTGEQLGTWTAHPIAQVGRYTLLSDRTLRADWTYGGR